MSCFLMKTNYFMWNHFVFFLGPESNQNVTRGGWRASVFPASCYWIYLIASFDLMCVCLEGLDLSSSLPPTPPLSFLRSVRYPRSWPRSAGHRSSCVQMALSQILFHWQKVFSSSRPPLRQDVLWGRRITHGLTSSICAAGDVWRQI